jgi:isopentenyl-diphosphate Delta-isomerase
MNCICVFLSKTLFMKNEYCFEVDEEDRILGTLSKYESHTINPNTGLTPLHRAFSVFLIRPGVSGFELLLQQRSKHKFTFPLMWANSCCSHPIDGIGEDTPDVLTGIALAAIRKLKHELGIPFEIVSELKSHLHNCYYLDP